MLHELPKFIDPMRLAKEGKHLEGQLQIARMGRLLPCLLVGEGCVLAQLDFAMDEHRNLPCLTGHLSTSLVLQCQRCLGPLELPLEIDLTLGMVTTLEQAQRLADEYDPLVVQEGLVSLSELIEDELILNLPQVARHAQAQCIMDYHPRGTEQLPKSHDAENHPFAVLTELKSHKH